MAHDGLITYQQVEQSRFAANRINDMKKKWSDNYSWYPVEQNEQYSHLDRVYDECRKNFGKERFDSYARVNRLNKRVTETECDRCLQRQKEALANANADGVDHLNYKPSETTNGEYGLVPPSRIFWCTRIL